MSKEERIEAAIILGKTQYGMELSSILKDVLGSKRFKASFEKLKGTTETITYADAIPHFLKIAEFYGICVPTMVESYKRKVGFKC